MEHSKSTDASVQSTTDSNDDNLSSIYENSTVVNYGISTATVFTSSSNVGDRHHSSGVGDRHHSSGLFPLSRCKDGGSDDKRETSFQLSVEEDRLPKKTKNTDALPIPLPPTPSSPEGVLPPLPKVETYLTEPRPTNVLPPDFSPADNPESIAQTVITSDNEDLAILVNFIRSHDKYLSRKYFCEGLIGFAQDSLENSPHYVMTFLLECVPPSPLVLDFLLRVKLVRI